MAILGVVLLVSQNAAQTVGGMLIVSAALRL
jgi:hypothetical protein